MSSKPKVENVSGDKSRDFSSYPENLKAVALYRWKFVKRVLVDNNVTKFSPKWLDPLIVELMFVHYLAVRQLIQPQLHSMQTLLILPLSLILLISFRYHS